ncbi:MAG: hypothetical protein PHI98_05860 [Eubacteriales bacterium]|nr:hypothetical protein [Eubacteriales bacterium]
MDCIHFRQSTSCVFGRAENRPPDRQSQSIRIDFGWFFGTLQTTQGFTMLDFSSLCTVSHNAQSECFKILQSTRLQLAGQSVSIHTQQSASRAALRRAAVSWDTP